MTTVTINTAIIIIDIASIISIQHESIGRKRRRWRGSEGGRQREIIISMK
jgi:hypothetical protein